MKVSQFLASAVVIAFATVITIIGIQTAGEIWRTGTIAVWADSQTAAFIAFGWLAVGIVWQRVWRQG